MSSDEMFPYWRAWPFLAALCLLLALVGCQPSDEAPPAERAAQESRRGLSVEKPAAAPTTEMKDGGEVAEPELDAERHHHPVLDVSGIVPHLPDQVEPAIDTLNGRLRNLEVGHETSLRTGRARWVQAIRSRSPRKT